MATPLRRAGVPKMMTLDLDVLPLIPHLTNSQKALGKLVSELIRGEVRRREQRAVYLAAGALPWMCDDDKL
jgi:hypothetical protein